MSEMKTIPFIAPYYKGQVIPRYSMSMCKEFDGDCHKFAKKYIKFQWQNGVCESSAPCKWTNYESHVCSPEEITQSHYDTGRLYLCPPAQKLFFLNNFEIYPNMYVVHNIVPNYDGSLDKKEVQEEMKNFWVAREEMRSYPDLTINEGYPILYKPEFIGRY